MHRPHEDLQARAMSCFWEVSVNERVRFPSVTISFVRVHPIEYDLCEHLSTAAFFRVLLLWVT